MLLLISPQVGVSVPQDREINFAVDKVTLALSLEGSGQGQRSNTSSPASDSPGACPLLHSHRGSLKFLDTTLKLLVGYLLTNFGHVLGVKIAF